MKTATDPPPHATVDGQCSICGHRRPAVDLVARRSLRAALSAAIDAMTTQRVVAVGIPSMICGGCLRDARHRYLATRLEAERGQLSDLEGEIARKAVDHASIAVHVEEQFAQTTTPGQRIADAVARVGGSWRFVISFIAMMAAWITVNSLVLGHGAFDPYPFILLNLALSCLAALQAPIIMMSQNRVSSRDRMQADEDFRVNLKAELEIASLHDKLDHLLHTRWENLLQVQEEQADMLRELIEGSGRPLQP